MIYRYTYWNQGLRCAEPQQVLFAMVLLDWRRDQL